MTNKLDYLWKPVYLWLKYFLIVIIGKEPYIEKYNGTIYNIHPRAVRGLCLNLDAINFQATLGGMPIQVEILWEDIKRFGAE